MEIKTKRVRDLFLVSSGSNKVYLTCTNGDSSHTHTLYFGLEPEYAKELAHYLLAAVAKVKQERN